MSRAGAGDRDGATHRDYERRDLDTTQLVTLAWFHDESSFCSVCKVCERPLHGAQTERRGMAVALGDRNQESGIRDQA